jgi:competence protein ComEA
LSCVRRSANLYQKPPMKWSEFVRDYLRFTRKDRIAVLAATLIMVLAILYPEIQKKFTPKKNVTLDTSWIAAVKNLQIKDTGYNKPDNRNYDDDNSQAFQYDKRNSSYQADNALAKGELFYFDPNTASPSDWKRLGLRDKTIQTIQNYLSKGGKFRKPEDLQRVYGLYQNEYERLQPYVRIESAFENKPSETFLNTSKEKIETKSYSSLYSIIDINSADTSAFISLPGIGSKLAARIVNFRDKLGGFYTVEQVKETFGLPDSTYQKIKQYLKLDNPSVKKININTATVDELKAHPYIKYSLANPIVAYRNEHGLFSKVEDLKKVMVVTEEIYKRLELYIIIYNHTEDSKNDKSSSL